MGRAATPSTANLVRDTFPLVEGFKMRKAPEPTKVQGAFQNHNQQRDSTRPIRFSGTDNPRHLRAIAALLRRPVSRHELDGIAGAANSPDLVAELRRRGLEVPCERINFVDRDGNVCRPGVYHFTVGDRRRWWAWRREVSA